MDIRVDGKELMAPGLVPFTRDDAQVRKVVPGQLEALKLAMAESGGDELIFEAAGEHYLVSASKLEAAWTFTMPRVGQSIEAGGLQGTIVHTDDERNLTRALIATGGAASLLGITLAGLSRHTGLDVPHAFLLGQLGIHAMLLTGMGFGDGLDRQDGRRAALAQFTEPI